MMTKVDKRTRAALFRQRLAQAIAETGTNRSKLARETGVDRSTISQIMARGETRLPNAQLVADCAATLGVSTDWLLGLTDRPERAGDLVDAVVGVTTAQRTSADEQIIDWHREANGYKIRHVAATLPDILKTSDVLAWEYNRFIAKTPDQAIGAMTDRMDWLRDSNSDYEIAVPRHELESFAAGEGYYSGLAPDIRAAQIERLTRDTRDLYPSLRIFIFDARRQFRAPITVFGPLLGVIYVGQIYLAFRSEDRVRSLTRHFDWLVRECEIDARQTPDFIDGLRNLATGA